MYCVENALKWWIAFLFETYRGCFLNKINECSSGWFYYAICPYDIQVSKKNTRYSEMWRQLYHQLAGNVQSESRRLQFYWLPLKMLVSRTFETSELLKQRQSATAQKTRSFSNSADRNFSLTNNVIFHDATYRMSHSLPNTALIYNFNTNENIATKFEQDYVRCVRNVKECVCSAATSCDTQQWPASQPAS